MKKRVVAMLLAASMVLAACGGTAAAPAAAPAEEKVEEKKEEATEAVEEAAEEVAEEAEEATEEAAASATALVPKYGDKIVVGFECVNYSDTHLTNVRNAVNWQNEQKGNPYDIQMVDSQNDTAIQWNNINQMLNKGCDIFACGYSNYDNYQQLFDLAKEYDLPFITYNTNAPDHEISADYLDKYYFVSSYADGSGIIQGEAAAEYWNEHPEADRNGNGVLDYVMLRGTPGFYDTIVRTKYSVEKIEEAGIKVNEVQAIDAEFNRAKAQDLMQPVITASIDDIDFVIANNDDMALGAIEALKAAGYLDGTPEKYIPVLGVDATAVGVEAIKDGTMLVTSLNNAVYMGRAIWYAIDAFATGQELTTEKLEAEGLKGCKVNEFHEIWIDYTRIDASNTEMANFENYY